MNLKHPSMVAAFDLVICLLLVFVILVLVKKDPTPTAIQTAGTYAVTIQWPDGSNNDIDMYVRDPQGNICYFANPDVNLMHLAYDNLGHAITGGVVQSGEVVVIRGFEAGEYVVNVHAYETIEDPTPVLVTLYSLSGADEAVVQAKVVLEAEGSEVTAFRFVVQENGKIGKVSELPLEMVSEYGGTEYS